MICHLVDSFCIFILRGAQWLCIHIWLSFVQTSETILLETCCTATPPGPSLYPASPEPPHTTTPHSSSSPNLHLTYAPSFPPVSLPHPPWTICTPHSTPPTFQPPEPHPTSAPSFWISSLLVAHRLCIQNLVEFARRARIYIFFTPPPFGWFFGGTFLNKSCQKSHHLQLCS